MNKLIKIRNHILSQLEKGILKEGDKLPGARDIANETGVSFAKVQQGLEKLVQDGILETIARQGTYVQRDWQKRILQTNFTTYSPGLPWLPGLERLLSDKIPDLRICSVFRNSVFELKTTLTVQRNYDDYMDLTDIFNQLFPDKSLFFSHPFNSFYLDGKLPGIPFVFSPRVIFFNPEILKKADCATPRPGWTWDEFIEALKRVRCMLPSEKVFSWSLQPYIWMNFIFRAGGCLISHDTADPIKIDDPKTQYGLKLYSDLKKVVGLERSNEDSINDFLKGEVAFLIGAREFVPFLEAAGMRHWNVVPFPYIMGGEDVTAQATDLVCIRKSCASPQLAAQFVEFMLSEDVQDFIALQKYGIPIRKSSAFKSLDIEDPVDSIFLSESAKITAEYNLNSPELSTLIQGGIHQILQNDLDIETETKRLASAVRTFLDVKYKGALPHIIKELKTG